MDKYINAPFDKETADSLKAGDYVYITGKVYTARDAAHQRMYDAMIGGSGIPIDLNNNIIY